MADDDAVEEVKAMLAELGALTRQVDAVSTSVYALRRRALHFLLDHDVSQRECARILGVTPMAVHLAVKNGSTP